MHMWTCSKCGRIFDKENQMHSCHMIPLEEHFKNKEKAKELFDHLVKEISSDIGDIKIISLPCCIHLYGKYDFLAALPKKGHLEIRFSMESKLDSPRLKISVPVSLTSVKNVINISSKEEINAELLSWITQAYNLKS